MGVQASSFPFLVHLSLLLISSLRSLATTEQPGNQTDHEALLHFKSKISSDPLGVVSSWNNATHFCSWHGVTCAPRHQRVIALILNSSKLVGSITPFLGNLSFLRVLNLEDNGFGLQIPQKVWTLRRLETFRLGNNSVVGFIPSNISCSSNLKVLHLYGNLLSGTVPDVLGCVSNLQVLVLSHNNLEGRIPSFLGNLSSLTALGLSDNNMTGTIPQSLGQLKNLVAFSIYSNRFSGSLPSSIFNLSNLRLFSVTENYLHGSLPADLGTTMPNVEGLYLYHNQFTGTIPPSISNATELTDFHVGMNRFTRSLPSLHLLKNLRTFGVEQNYIGSGREGDLDFICTLLNATSLNALSLAANNFGGKVPTCVGNLSTHLIRIGFENNRLKGEIPLTIGNLINLEWLSFSDNQLSGYIPSNIGSLKKLQRLFLDTNQFSGHIPSSFGNLTILTELSMTNNILEGEIVPSLGKLKHLVALDVSENKLGGSIPQELFSISPFSVCLYLNGNQLKGKIPTTIANLRKIAELDLSRNSLFGEIPSTLGSCTSLGLLDMSGNLLEGHIAPSLSSLKGLQVLNLSNNKLTGEIPAFLASFKSLEALDLSRNDFEGMVPSQGVFVNATAVTLAGNNKLCGGELELHLPKCDLGKTNKTWKISLLITFPILGGAAFISVAMFHLWRKGKGNKSMENEISQDQFIDLSYRALFKATDGFSSTNLIGTGSSGAVYKGVLLDRDGGSVAIKVFNLLQQGASKSFVAECTALRNLRHRNLVKILTVCSSIDGQGNEFKALVYELMSNGSLEEWLHPATSSPPLKVLGLLQRMSIAVDVASALDYLHHHCETPIVHCDLKPSNILLNHEMTAHLGDFGLVRFLGGGHDDQSGFQNETTSSIVIKGSIGYVPPEYGMGGEISTCGDMYSYGVLLLELFTGKRPTDDTFGDGSSNLIESAKGALPERLAEVIDPALLRELEELAVADGRVNRRLMEMIQECLALVLEIGVSCCDERPRKRGVSSDVVTQLRLKLEMVTGLYMRRQQVS